MLTLRKSRHRGYADHGWLKSRHSFSFAEYYDPEYMGWGNLRVINEDRIDPGTGFGSHGHRDMEIVSYVLSGELAHRDSMGNVAMIPPGDVQRMSAGSGVRHSEFNHADGQVTHFLQIWIQPDAIGIEPGYEQKTIPAARKRGKLRLIASSDARDGSVLVHQDVSIFASILDGDDRLEHPLAPGRLGYVHVARGTLTVNGIALEAGDALKLADEGSVVLEAGKDAEILLFDLPR